MADRFPTSPDIPSKRKLNSRTWDLGGGRKRTIIAQKPMNYEVSPGTFENIDRDAVKQGDGSYKVNKAAYDLVISPESPSYSYLKIDMIL